MDIIKFFSVLFCAAFLVACNGGASEGNRGFIKVEDGHFVKGGAPYYFIGANMWYAAVLASEGEAGDRGRLSRELDSLQAMGVDNIRVCVGSDGLCSLNPEGMTIPFSSALTTLWRNLEEGI